VSKKETKNIVSILEGLVESLPGVATIGAGTALDVATVPYSFIGVAVSIALPSILLQLKSGFAYKRIKELCNGLEARFDELDQSVIKSDEFSALTQGLVEQYLKETNTIKSEMLANYFFNSAISGIDVNYNDQILIAIERISPQQFSALVDISEAVIAAMKWDIENHGKVTFEYGITVIQDQLESIEVKETDILKMDVLDDTLRTLSNLDLVHVRDISTPVLGGAPTSLQVRNITPLGRKLINYIIPDKQDLINELDTYSKSS